MRRSVLGVLTALALASAACQQILGHEPFEFDDATNGDGLEGKGCTDQADCRDLACVLGVCRIPCDDDQGCPKTSICLRDERSEVSGCRLSGQIETECDEATPCESPTLSCGIDGTCRVPCSADNSCAINGQYCIQGTCVSENEASWQTSWGLCAAALSAEQRKAQSGILCQGADLTGCNLNQPGMASLDTCATEEACQEAAASGAESCPNACDEGRYRCQGAELQECRTDQTGYEQTEICASEAICLRSKDQNLGQCLAPKCGPGGAEPQARCVAGNAEVCDVTQQTYETKNCSDAEQCNPANGTCGVLYKIDPTEVTRQKYAAFVASAPQPNPAKAIPACQWNTSYEPDSACVAAAAGTVECADGLHLPGVCTTYPDLCSGNTPFACGDFPQTCVDWCDAHDYCAAKGLRLCGRMNDPGAGVPFADYQDAGQSEWTNACSAGGDFSWVFGDASAVKCNNSQFWSKAPQPLPVKNRAQCVSPVSAYAGVFDLSGNVAEWESSCEKPAMDEDLAGDVLCRVRGGSYTSTSKQITCSAGEARARSSAAPTVGFRCCE